MIPKLSSPWGGTSSSLSLFYYLIKVFSSTVIAGSFFYPGLSAALGHAGGGIKLCISSSWLKSDLVWEDFLKSSSSSKLA